MITLRFDVCTGEAPTILCLGAHPDDIEIGCGGAVLRLKRQYPRAFFHWIVFSGAGERCAEAHRAARLFTDGAECSVVVGQFKDGFLPYEGKSVKAFFEEIKTKISPDLIFTHYRRDAHQDHRLLSELTWNTFRNHLILEYEIPKYDGDISSPNVFFPIDDDIREDKIDYLFEAFRSQQCKPWFRRETFCGLMRMRGMECNSPTGYAEGFYCRKMVI